MTVWAQRSTIALNDERAGRTDEKSKGSPFSEINKYTALTEHEADIF